MDSLRINFDPVVRYDWSELAAVSPETREFFETGGTFNSDIAILAKLDSGKLFDYERDRMCASIDEVSTKAASEAVFSWFQHRLHEPSGISMYWTLRMCEFASASKAVSRDFVSPLDR
jgi:hypothetical protein